MGRLNLGRTTHRTCLRDSYRRGVNLCISEYAVEGNRGVTIGIGGRFVGVGSVCAHRRIGGPVWVLTVGC